MSSAVHALRVPAVEFPLFGFARHADSGMTGIMPPAGLCRVEKRQRTRFTWVH